MCLYQRACCIASHVPILRGLVMMPLVAGNSQEGFLAGEEY